MVEDGDKGCRVIEFGACDGRPEGGSHFACGGLIPGIPRDAAPWCSAVVQKSLMIVFSSRSSRRDPACAGRAARRHR